MTELWIGLIGIVSTIAGSVVSATVARKKYEKEVAQIQADTDNKRAQTEELQIKNTDELLRISMERIVQPLEKQVIKLTNEISKFRKAFEKIPTCPGAPGCPVSLELQRNEGTTEQQ